MSTGATESASSGEITKQGLERLPAKTPYAHDAILRIQRLDATLGGLGLLEVAKGLLPAEVFEITIINLSDVPAPAPGAATAPRPTAQKRELMFTTLIRDEIANQRYMQFHY